MPPEGTAFSIFLILLLCVKVRPRRCDGGGGVLWVEAAQSTPNWFLIGEETWIRKTAFTPGDKEAWVCCNWGYQSVNVCVGVCASMRRFH